MKKNVCLLSCVLVLALGAIAQADVVTVENSGFEQPNAGKIKAWNGENGTDIPGWASDTAAIDSGVESDTTHGLYASFFMGGDPVAYNLTAYQIQAGEVFTLTVAAHDTWTDSGLADLQISLYYDVAGVRNVVATQTYVDISQAWADYTLQFNADDVAASIGNKIGIEIANVNGPTTNGWGSWLGADEVRLNVVPEPATMALLGLGSLVALRKRRQA
jgi:hypothetical protein